MNEAPIISLSNNIKTVNTVYVSESENRLITGSVDCHVKIYDLNEVSLAYQSSKLSTNLSSQSRSLV